MKHTPGKWAWGNREIYSQFGVVATISNLGNIREEGANARLIAAAPELLEACELVIDLWGKAPSPMTYNKIQAAIAKARGDK